LPDRGAENFAGLSGSRRVEPRPAALFLVPQCTSGTCPSVARRCPSTRSDPYVPSRQPCTKESAARFPSRPEVPQTHARPHPITTSALRIPSPSAAYTSLPCTLTRVASPHTVQPKRYYPRPHPGRTLHRACSLLAQRASCSRSVVAVRSLSLSDSRYHTLCSTAPSSHFPGPSAGC
jgi:hypothetical protein